MRSGGSAVQAWAKKHDRPVFLGEFGAYDKAPLEDRIKYTSAVARAAEEHSGPHNAWFWQGEKQGGGVLNDMMCHSVEVVRYLLTGNLSEVLVVVGAIVALQLQAGLDGFLAVEKHLMARRGLARSTWPRVRAPESQPAPPSDPRRATH